MLNYTKAMDYFLKAAALHSDDAHFSLAMIYREGLGCPKDIPRSVAHLAVAASWGHVRALNFLAHALHDGDSWLAQYGREQHALRRHRAMLSVLLATPAHDGEMGAGGAGAATASPRASSSGNATAAADALLRNSLVFDEFELIKIYLSNGQVVPMPYPLGNPAGAPTRVRLMRKSVVVTTLTLDILSMCAGSCEAALPLLKHIAEMSYRPKDVTSQALKKYIKGYIPVRDTGSSLSFTAFARFLFLGDYWAALRLYEEAADLGVSAAQENAAYLIEKMAPTECPQLAEDLVKEEEDQEYASTAVWMGGEDSPASAECATAAECCVKYLERRAAHRWAQLSRVGEPRAMRKMAVALQAGLDRSAVGVTPQSSLDTGLADLTFTAGGGTALPPQQQAALLFALAGEQGDTESMLNLGWMLYYGSHGEWLHVFEFHLQ
jgi:TPR repeat protein